MEIFKIKNVIDTLSKLVSISTEKEEELLKKYFNNINFTEFHPRHGIDSLNDCLVEYINSKNERKI